MKLLLVVAMLCMALSACNLSNRSTAATRRDQGYSPQPTALSDDEKHKLYTSALAASEAPFDSELFKRVCRKIGIFDARNDPTDQYMSFIQAQIEWGLKPAAKQFRQEISTKEKAQAYVATHLP